MKLSPKHVTKQGMNVYTKENKKEWTHDIHRIQIEWENEIHDSNNQ